MNSMKKKTLIATALVAVFSASSAFAWMHNDDGNNDGKGFGSCSSGQRMGHFQKSGHGKPGMGMKSQKMQEFLNRSYTADEIRTLNEARLIHQGNPNVKVGKVTSTSDGYKVTIVTKDNSLVKELELAKNGMPLERYNRMKERMAAKEKKQQG